MADNTLQFIITAQNNAKQAFNEAKNSLEDLQKSAKNMNTDFGRATAASQNIAKGLGIALTAVGGAALIGAKGAGDFNAEIRRAGAYVDATTEELKEFERVAKEAAKGTTFSSLQAAEALGAFVGGEISATEAARDLGSVIDLALIAKMTSLQEAVDFSSAALIQFGNEGIEINDVMDTMAAVAANVSTNTTAYGRAFVDAAASSKAAGLSFRNTNVLISQLAAGGANLNTIATAINSALVNIQNPGKQAQDALDGVGLSIEGLQKALSAGSTELLGYLQQGFEEAQKSGQGFAFLANVLGRQAAPEFAMAMALTNEQIALTAEYFDDIEGKGKELAETLRNAQPPMDLIKKEFGEIANNLGELLLPALRLFSDFLPKIIDKVKELAQWLKENEIVVWMIAGAISGALMPALIAAIPVIAGMIGAFALGAIALAPWVAGGTLILGLVGGIFWLIKNWDTAKKFLSETWEGLKIIAGETFGPMIENIKNLFQGLSDGIKTIWDGIVETVKSAVNSVISLINKMIDAINSIKIKIPKIEYWPGKFFGGFEIAFPQIPTIPALAKGGIVNRPTLAMIGEAGPEAVLPLSSAYSPIPAYAGANINVYIQGGYYLDRDAADEIGEKIIQKLKQTMKL